MKTLEQRIVRVVAEVPTRRTKEERPGDIATRVHVCVEGKRKANGSSQLLDMDMQEFIPPADDSTIVVIQLKPKSNGYASPR